MQEVKMVIFDFDGVITDTEWAHAQAKRQICAEKHYKLEEEPDLSVGCSNQEFWERVLRTNQKEGDAQELAKQQYEMVLQILTEREQPESEGLSSLLCQLKEMGKLLVICSGSDRFFVRQILERLGIEDFFDCVMGGDGIEHLKPAPDIFLKMLQRMNVSPKEAVVIEDSASGCKAAKEAGIYCLGYLNHKKNKQNLAITDSVINELTEVLNYIS